MLYLTSEQIILIHSLVIDETGGAHGVRNLDALSAAEGLPKQAVFGKELYPTIFLKAAVYIRSIIDGHPFLDGDKRTAIAAAAVFLENNGYLLTAKAGEVEKLALKVTNRKPNLAAIAKWLKKNTKNKRGEV